MNTISNFDLKSLYLNLSSLNLKEKNIAIHYKIMHEKNSE